jgi:hypothetical protein
VGLGAGVAEVMVVRTSAALPSETVTVTPAKMPVLGHGGVLGALHLTVPEMTPTVKANVALIPGAEPLEAMNTGTVWLA